jgi:ATP-dependent DNA helicase RecQ
VQAVTQLFSEMEKRLFILVSGGEYPVVSLTDKGMEAMKSGTREPLHWPIHDEVVKATGLKNQGDTAGLETRELGFDEALFGKLKKLRNALAESEGKPAYTVFNNATLEFFTRLKPTTPAAAAKIRGVGEVKAKTYLPEFLAVIQKHTKGR